MTCLKCNGSGDCQPCRGTGLSGSAPWRPVAPGARLCPWCLGSKCCDRCVGMRTTHDDAFRPYISVQHSERVPRPIFVAALTGAPWRFLQIPSSVMTRSEPAQLAYVSWRCRTHYRDEHGICYLFGRITAYEWVKGRMETITLDIRGRVTGVKTKPAPVGRGSVKIANKYVEVSRSGHLHIEHAG
jgi:hypothetical protein